MSRPGPHPEPAAVEFVIDDEADDGSDLADVAPARRRPVSHRRLWWIFAGAVTALIAVTALVQAHQTEREPGATSSTSAPTPPAASPPAFVFEPPEQRNLGAPPRPAPCPEGLDGSSLCRDGKGLPAGVVAAVRQRLPGVQVASAATQLLRQTAGTYTPPDLWSRTVQLRSGAARMQILVQRGGAASRRPIVSNEIDNGDRTAMLVQRTIGGYSVSIAFSGPSGVPPTFGTITSLAQDPRLVLVA